MTSTNSIWSPCGVARQSRTCYHHLAGQLGVALSNALIRRRLATAGDRTGCVSHLAGPFPNATLARLVETRCVTPLSIPRALRLTQKGRAFFARLGAEVPF
jgi:hypothetical protein